MRARNSYKRGKITTVEAAEFLDSAYIACLEHGNYTTKDVIGTRGYSIFNAVSIKCGISIETSRGRRLINLESDPSSVDAKKLLNAHINYYKVFKNPRRNEKKARYSDAITNDFKAEYVLACEAIKKMVDHAEFVKTAVDGITNSNMDYFKNTLSSELFSYFEMIADESLGMLDEYNSRGLNG